MKIYLVKKEKGRVYKSEDIVRALFGFSLVHDEDRAPRLLPAEEQGGSAQNAPAGPLFISISDTRNYWACAIESYPLGIDMEELGRAVKPDIAKRLHKDEQAYLSALSEGGREWTEEFLSIWTRKEAWSKYCSKGLRLGFSRFSVLGPLQADLPAEGQSNTELSAAGQKTAVPVASFNYSNLVFGIAGAEKAEIVPTQYDAPMEVSALDYAAGLLDARAYTSAALMEKLLDRGYRREESEEALKKLKEYGYVNDDAFAESLARRAAESGKGSRRISLELRDKGIDKGLAAQAASEYKESDYSRALAIARKMAESSGADLSAPPEADDEALSMEQKKALYSRRQKFAGKVSRKLSSLGYDASVIYSVLEDLGF